MFSWMKQVLKTPADAERQAWWNARLSALEGALGRSDGTVYAASSARHREGFADVLRFRSYVSGITYVTCNLIGHPRQVPNRWGQYELMMYSKRRTVTGSGNDLQERLTLTAIPVPGAVWLLGSAVGLLGFARRKVAASS